MRMAPLVLAIALLAAGCVGSAPDSANQVASQADGTSGAWANQTLYLTGDMGTSGAEPTGEPERVPAGNFYTAWTAGEEQPTWQGSTTETGLHISEAKLTFFYTAESATATTGPQGEGFPEFVVYVGTEAAPRGWASVEGPDVVQNGEQVRVEANLSLPAGGLVLPAGVEPVVKLAPVQGQGSQENTRIEFLVNGTETPSRAELTARTMDVEESRATEVVDGGGTLAGSAYATGSGGETSSAEHEVQIEDRHVGLVASLERVQGAGVADIDLQLVGPDGEVRAQSVTPEDDEGLALYAANVEAIGTGTWTLRVVNYGNAAVEYDLTADALVAPDALADE